MPDIKESIERIRKKLVVEKSTKNIGTPVRIDDLENVLKELTRLQEENQIMKGSKLSYWHIYNDLKKNSVSKDTIREKIKEIQEQKDLYDANNFRDIEEINTKSCQISVLKELLGDEANENSNS